MINPNDKCIQWTEKANEDMSLISMIDLLYKAELMEKYSEDTKRFLTFDNSNFLYKGFYNEYNELLNTIVEIFFPEPVFIPSEINNNKTNEFYMWTTINAILYIVWYNKIEKSRPRGYEKIVKELDNALYYLYGYANSKEVDKLISFPAHQNEIIERLEDFFININRPQQGDKIIKEIKKDFKITKITATRKKKIINANKKIQEDIKIKYNLSDDELQKLPIIGQLQTKI